MCSYVHMYKLIMGCSAPKCTCTMTGAKLALHMTQCRNLSSLQCEICEVTFKNPMSKCRHKKHNTCKPPEDPSPLWFYPHTDEMKMLLAPRQKQVYAAKDMELKEAMSLRGTKPALGEGGAILTYIRESDGYLNATELCKKTGLPVRNPMLFKDWQKLKATRKNIAKAETWGLTEDMLIDRVKNVYNKKTVWIHPCLVPEFVVWCGLKFNMETVAIIQSFAVSKPTSPESQFLQSLPEDDGKPDTELRKG